MQHKARALAAISCSAVIAGTLTFPAQAAQQQTAPVGKKSLSALNTLPDPWAKSLGDAVAFAGGGKSSITTDGGQLQIVVQPVVNGVATTGDGKSKRIKRADLEDAWKQLKGNPKGVVAGRTTGGKTVSVPVIFEPTIDVTKKRVVLTARAAKGDIDPKVEEAFPKVGAVENEAIGSKFRYLSVVGSDHGSQAWRLTSATKTGRLSKGRVAPGAFN